MRLFSKSLEITELVEKIEWSGDDKQVARTLTITAVKCPNDPNLPLITLETGDILTMQADDGTELFFGVVMKPSWAAGTNIATYTAYDLMLYANSSSGSWVIDEYPEQFTRRACAEFGIEVEYAQETNVHVYSLALNKTLYEAIMIGYTEAYRQNFGAYAYIPLMKRNKLVVIPKGMDCEVVLNNDNLTSAKYSEDGTQIVNRVVITDKSGKEIKAVEDVASRQRYGTIQKIVSQEKGKDATTEAQGMLKSIGQNATVQAISDYRAVAGYSLLVYEPETGLYGRFHIQNDKHTFSDGKAIMSLTLAFETLMDEYDIDTGGNK